jgi:ABC-type branched-subunit amino acid transport system ATPase component
MHEVIPDETGAKVLSFKEATIPPSSPNMTGVEKATFDLGRGDILLIKVEEGREHTPLADAAQGLVTPISGRVSFMGEDWQAMRARRQSVQRGKTRRVFEHYGWIANLNVMENICLAESHHSGRRTADIQAEALLLARQCGLGEIPEARSSGIHSMVLRKLEWVRAFIGTPDLIILERPMHKAPRADMNRLVELVCEASRNGAAVIWLTDEDRVWNCTGLGPVRRYQFDGEKLVSV